MLQVTLQLLESQKYTTSAHGFNNITVVNLYLIAFNLKSAIITILIFNFMKKKKQPTGERWFMMATLSTRAFRIKEHQIMFEQ